jgi:hypothetical protein
MLVEARSICQFSAVTPRSQRPRLKIRVDTAMRRAMHADVSLTVSWWSAWRPWCRVFTLAALAVVASSCERASGPPVHDAEAYAKLQASLNARVGAIHDVAVEGSIVDDAGQTLGFRYAMQQPRFMAGELLDKEGRRLRAFLFDGKHLAIVDDAQKTTVRHDLSVSEETMLLTLHQVFSPFVCEGWRPPLLKVSGVTAIPDGERLTVTVPVGEGGVKEQRLVLGRSGAFVSRQSIGDDGTVLTSTTVLDSATDAGTGLIFPIKWAMQEGESRGTITLSRWHINAGVDAARFATTTPVGYSEQRP